MKKLIIALCLIMLCFTGCKQSIKIKGDTPHIVLGQEYTLELDAPKDAEITFSSMDTNIASVDENGVIKGLGNGITVITAQAGDSYDNIGVVVGSGVAQYINADGNTVASISPTAVQDASAINESDITALAISLVGGGSEDVTISTQRTYEVKITRTPADSVDKISLRIADPSVARVDGNMLVGVSRGKTTLTASAPNGVSTEMIVRVK